MFHYEEVRQGSRPYIIAEIGANHNGDMELAKKLIVVAKECGADCAKFQSWTKSSLFSHIVYKDNSALENEIEAHQISRENHFMLKEFCDSIGIEFNSTPFSNEEMDLLTDELKVSFIKVASMDLNNLPFLQYAASKHKPIVMSTGLCGMDTVVQAVNCLERNGCQEIVLLHCVSLYPPQAEQVNLNNIDMLREYFGYPVGYSDHTIGITAPVMSIAKKACVIEKHFTLDKEMAGWDHKVSASPDELKMISQAAMDGHKMLGNYRRVVSEDQEKQNAFRRSIVTARAVKRGQVVTEADITYKRPGTGLAPSDSRFVIGKTIKRDMGADEIIRMEDF